MDLNFSLEVTNASTATTPNAVSNIWIEDDVRKLADSYLMAKIGE